VTAIIVLILVIAAPLLWDLRDQRERRLERRNGRRLHRYLAQLPPSRPW
jgi:hypothetical protein